MNFTVCLKEKLILLSNMLNRFSTSITAFSIKFVMGVFDGFFNLSSFFPRVTPAANSRLVCNSIKV
jgi:hypothetical protein